MASVLVFCGSATGKNPAYAQAAKSLGIYLGEQGHHLITGGGSVGLMGVVADATLAAGGKATGIIPQMLENREVGHSDMTELIVVSDMHTRKALMYDKCDMAIVLPGGVGTLDECFEFLCWHRLRLHQKPLAIWNVEGIYDGLEQVLGIMEDEGFTGKTRAMDCFIEKELKDLVQALDL